MIFVRFFNSESEQAAVKAETRWKVERDWMEIRKPLRIDSVLIS